MDDTPENSKDGHSSQLRAYFAVRSPYSRLGLHKLANAGFGGELINFTGPPDGIEFANPTENPHKLAYYQQDVFRMTLRANLSLALPNPFDPDFTASGLAFEAAKRDGFALPFALAMSDARWGGGAQSV
jgi:2-hydroxychromene-2-carboxylate isomerase